jgi:hypothetical protein
VLASFTSIAFSLSFVLRTRHRRLITRLATAMVCVAIAGLIGTLIWDSLYPYALRWLPGLAKLPR